MKKSKRISPPSLLVEGADNSLVVPTKFQVRTLADRLSEVVREQIILGDIEPGVAIKQDVLAAQLQVSKIPLREALSRLEQDGLVLSIPNRGFVVTPLTLTEAEEVFALRLKIEPDAVAKGAVQADDRHHKRASMILKELTAASKKDDPSVGILHRNFHLALIEPADQKLTLALMSRLHAIAERYVRKHLEPPGRPGRAKDEHHDILDAWRHGDRSGVKKLVRAHIVRTAEELNQELKLTGPHAEGRDGAKQSRK